MVGGASHRSADSRRDLVRGPTCHTERPFSKVWCDTRARLADPETALARWRDVDHLRVVDTGARRPLATPGDNTRHGRGRAFELGLDRAVATIAHPTGNLRGPRLLPARVPEPDPLYTTRHDDVHAYKIGL
jgi:hypothetical protein